MPKEEAGTTIEDCTEIQITEEDLSTHTRLDRFLADRTQLSRTTIKRLFEAQEITSKTPIKLNRMPPPHNLYSSQYSPTPSK